MKNKVYVGNLPYSLEEDMLREIFEKYGNMDDVKIIRYRDSGRSRGFGFVEFSTEEEAQASLEMNGQEVNERKLVVNIARDKEEGERKGRSSGGGRGRGQQGSRAGRHASGGYRGNGRGREGYSKGYDDDNRGNC